MMKAQFAMIEAGIALATIVSAIIFVSGWVNSSTANLSSQSAALQRSVALYDMVNALERNATYAACSLQASCSASMEKNMSELFEAGSVSIGAYAVQGSTCATAQVENQTLEVCVS